MTDDGPGETELLVMIHRTGVALLSGNYKVPFEVEQGHIES